MRNYPSSDLIQRWQTWALLLPPRPVRAASADHPASLAAPFIRRVYAFWRRTATRQVPSNTEHRQRGFIFFTARGWQRGGPDFD